MENPDWSGFAEGGSDEEWIWDEQLGDWVENPDWSGFAEGGSDEEWIWDEQIGDWVENPAWGMGGDFGGFGGAQAQSNDFGQW